MPTISTSIIRAGQVVPATATDNTDYLVARWVILASTDNGNVFSLRGSSHDVVVNGSLSGGVAIELGDALTDSGNRLVVNATGGVQATVTAVILTGSGSELINRGDIWGDSTGVAISGSGEIVNSGAIRASNGIGLRVDAQEAATGPTVIVNSGTISGWGFGIYTDGAAGKTVRITNTDDGVITHGLGGGNGFYSIGDTNDLLTNRGLIQGTVFLGPGNDVFDNRGGEVKSIDSVTLSREPGTIFGSNGNDRFVPGSSIEIINGGLDLGDTDVDTLDFRSGGGLRVSLVDTDGSDNTGRARGDTYTEIERVLGSQTGGDRLIGDDRNNTLEGFGGADDLRGRGGNDTIKGDRGIDTLRGGEGADRFRFNAPGDGGDLILDWDAGGVADRLVIGASGFGGGLEVGEPVSGAQFDSQATNVAQTATVRFIWETDAARLWFDRNGDASGGLSLIADLQAGATLTRDDIQLA